MRIGSKSAISFVPFSLHYTIMCQMHISGCMILISLFWWPESSLHFIPLTIAFKIIHCFSVALCVNYASQFAACCKARCLCGSEFIVRDLYAWIVFVDIPMVDYHEYNYYFDLAFCFWKAHFRFKSAEVWWKSSSLIPLPCHSMPWNPGCAV